RVPAPMSPSLGASPRHAECRLERGCRWKSPAVATSKHSVMHGQLGQTGIILEKKFDQALMEVLADLAGFLKAGIIFRCIWIQTAQMLARLGITKDAQKIVVRIEDQCRRFGCGKPLARFCESIERISAAHLPQIIH